MQSATLAASVCADPRDRERLQELLRQWSMPCIWQVWREHRRDFLSAAEARERAEKRLRESRDDDDVRRLEARIERLNREVASYSRGRQLMAREFQELRELVKAIAPELLVELPGLTEVDSILRIDPAQAADAVRQVADRLAALDMQAPAPPEAAPAVACESSDFRHGPGFRSVVWFGQTFDFTGNQAAVVAALWRPWLNETPDVPQEALQDAADVEAPLRVLFKDHPAWGAMIVPGATRGTFRLAKPDSAGDGKKTSP